MGSTWALVCPTALVLILLSSASKGHNFTDERLFEQREITFDSDIAKTIQEMQSPESFLMQKEADLTDFLDPEDDSRQRMLTPRGRRPGFWPRSHVGLPAPSYPVQFPVGQPTPENLHAICAHGDHRPRYPESYFPASGFGVQKMRATAVNNAEAWLSTCCKGNQTWERGVTLCCAKKAWELSIEKYCEEDISVKHPWYHCCKRSGSDRLKCFREDAPNPNYEPTEELPVTPLPSTIEFSFNPNTCQRTRITPYSARAIRGRRMKKPSTPPKIDINFPPGQPTADTIESVCRNQKLRPLYNIKCLPGLGHETLARQAKTINRIEKGFKQCCKKKESALNCADQKWREELNKFCLAKNGEQVDYPCCLGQNDQYSCFQLMSPDPYYNVTSAAEELSLNNICATHKIVKKRFAVGLPVNAFVTQCCPLSEQEKTVCFARLLQEMSQKLCASRKPSTPPTVRRCCKMPLQDIPQCTSKLLMDAVTKATNLLSQKRRKRCPIS